MLHWINANKQKLIPLLAVVILALLFLSYYFYNTSVQKTNSRNDSTHAQSSNSSNNSPTAEQAQSQNPFKHRGSLEEIHVQNYIHWMSHQKVAADEKWTHYKLTPERVEWLLEEVESGNYKHQEVYVEILTKWKAGDFSTADKDHNRIWTLQGGTVGRATGLLTREEEEEYLKKFRRKLN